jgi:hypothetical protein
VQPVHPVRQLNTLKIHKGEPMKKILLLGSILLLSAVWAVAQYDSQSSSESSGASKTVEGCLAGSNGSFTLTDKSGTAYQLTGDTAKLDKHVGHTIQVTGTSTTSSASKTSTDNSSGSMSGNAEMQQTFNVTSFKHVAANCNDMH